MIVASISLAVIVAVFAFGSDLRMIFVNTGSALQMVTSNGTSGG
jgi:hypothetical protein